eukprot:gene11787-24701_t
MENHDNNKPNPVVADTNNEEPQGMASLFDEHVRQEASGFIKLAIGGQIFIIIMMVSMINLMYGFAWDPTPIIKENMKIAIVSNDATNGIVNKALHYVIDHASDFNLNYKFVYLNVPINGTYNKNDLYDKVDDGTYWGALLLNSDSSSNLMKAVIKDPYSTYTSPSYDPSNALIYYYDEARDGFTYQFIIGNIGPSITNYMNSYIKKSLIIQFSKQNYNISNINPAIISNPIRQRVINIHPVKNAGLHTAAGNGMMQFYLISLLQGVIVIVLHLELQGKGIIQTHLVRFSVLHRILGCFIVSVAPPISLLMLGVGTDIIDAYTFFNWWAFCWLVMATIVGLVYALYRLCAIPVGVLIGQIYMFLMVSSSTGTLPFDGMPDFYKVGYALHLFNAVQGSRAILLNSGVNTNLSRNIGIFFIWVGIFIGLSFIYNYEPWFKSFQVMRGEEEDEEIEREAEHVRRLSMSACSDMSNNRDNNNVYEIEATENNNNFFIQQKQQQQPDNDNDNTNEDQPMQIHDLNGNLVVVSTTTQNETTQTQIPTTQTQIQSTQIHTTPNPVQNTTTTTTTIPLPLPQQSQSQPQPPPPLLLFPELDNVSIFHPQFRPIIKGIAIKGLIAEGALTLLFIVLLLLTYGNTWDPTQYYHNIEIAFVNCDIYDSTSISTATTNGIIGDTITKSLSKYSTPYTFTIKHLSCSGNNYNSIVKDIENQKYWGALYIHTNASYNLDKLMFNTSSTAIASYNNGIGATSLIFDAGRAGSFMPLLMQLWASGLIGLSNAILTSTQFIIYSSTTSQIDLKLSSFNTNTLISPIGMNIISLYTPVISGVDGSISSAAMSAYLGMAIQISIIMAAHRPLEALNVDYKQRLYLKIAHVTISAIFTALIPVISLLWYGMDLNASQFFAYWSMLALGMLAFGSFSFMNYHLFGQAIGGMCNLLLFALNQASSSSSLPLELQDDFFKLGYAMPFYQIITIGRYILHGSKLNIGQSIGVLFAWVGGVTIIAYRLQLRRERLHALAKAIKCATQQLQSSPVGRAIEYQFSNKNKKVTTG